MAKSPPLTIDEQPTTPGLSAGRHIPRAIGVYWPLLLALAVFASLLWSGINACRRQNDGHFIYPLDDAYIHMAIAKNLAQHGVWGVTRFAFGASSSSLLWSGVLGLIFKLPGSHDLVPLLLGAACGAAALSVVLWILRREEVPGLVVAVLLGGVVIGAPMVPLVISGMEAPGQILIDVLFLYAAARAAGGRVLSVRSTAALLVLAALAVAIRYEGLFLVGTACLVLAARGRWGLAFALGLAALTPVVIFGAISVRHGGFWLPNSVMLKGARPSFGSWRDAAYSLGGRAVEGLIVARWVGGLAVAAMIVLLIAFSKRREVSGRARSSPAGPMLVISLGTAILHMQFAALTWFSRYEGYLVVLLMLAIAVALGRDRLGLSGLARIEAAKRIVAVAIAAAFCLYPVFANGIMALGQVPAASHNVYEQQYQMARFLGRYYSDDTVVLNDIGAVCYFGDVRLIDTQGLDGMEVARQRLARTYRSALAADIARRQDARVAVVYQRFLQEMGGVPEDWTPVGTWGIGDNLICGDAFVTFYALRPDEIPALRANLLEFNRALPIGVSRHVSR
ncbi:MAG: hypothetical protein JWO87_3767 [Phycisphaerales bacterium]|nr:hypothetical protein [Phycisphaerales bacterium]